MYLPKECQNEKCRKRGCMRVEAGDKKTILITISGKYNFLKMLLTFAWRGIIKKFRSLFKGATRCSALISSA